MVGAQGFEGGEVHDLGMMPQEGIGCDLWWIPGIDLGSSHRIFFRDPITHRSVALLSPIPHAQQGRVSGVDNIEDPHVGLGGMLAMQSAGVLLQQAFPRDRHRQDQRIQWRMVKAFADQLSRCQKDARVIRWQRIELCDPIATLLSRHSAMQDDRVRALVVKGGQDRVEMSRALGQHQDCASSMERALDCERDRRRSCRLGGGDEVA
ncbi:hypothetical protein THIOKS11320075 [Thiocapsa sp. KS1]|nr:hypothetical protein THIOKS11320075 [Thiocapsa sp. KS1]